jgi:ABC-type sulfate transport system substrate-binding protein
VINRHADEDKGADKFKIKTYFKELEKGYLSQDTPGPAAYSTFKRDILSNFRMSFNGSFTRAKRNIEKPPK